MSSEPSTRAFQRRNKPRHKQIAINRRFCRNLNLIYPVKDNTTIKRSFHSILHANRSARVSQGRSKPRSSEIRNHSSILTKTKRYSFPVCDVSTFNRSFHSILHAERSARVFQCRKMPRNTQIAIIRRF